MITSCYRRPVVIRQWGPATSPLSVISESRGHVPQHHLEAIEGRDVTHVSQVSAGRQGHESEVALHAVRRVVPPAPPVGSAIPHGELPREPRPGNVSSVTRTPAAPAIGYFGERGNRPAGLHVHI